MSWRFRLTISPHGMLKQKKDAQGNVISYKTGDPELNEVSLLRFASKEDANKFAHKLFEPPLTVESYEIEQTDLPANFDYGTKQFLS